MQPQVVSSRLSAGVSASTAPLCRSTTPSTGRPAAKISSASARTGPGGLTASARARAAASCSTASIAPTLRSPPSMARRHSGMPRTEAGATWLSTRIARVTAASSTSSRVASPARPDAPGASAAASAVRARARRR